MTQRSTRFDRVPATDADRPEGKRTEDDRPEGERTAADRPQEESIDTGPPTREAILDFWAERYGVPRTVFDDYTFWERGKGKMWIFRGTPSSPVEIEALGMTFLRTRREHWKPTMDGVQRFGDHATDRVIHLDEDQSAQFVAGEDQEVAWDGDWGFLIVSHEIAGEAEPIGVGLYLYGELRSQVPKGRRREL